METPHAERRPHPRLKVNVRGLGEGALDFARWFRSSKFDLMAAFYGELDAPAGTRDVEDLERRFLAALRHGKRVLLARGIVTFVLALGVVATAAAAVARVVWVPSPLEMDVAMTLAALDRFAALSGSVTVVLVLARLLFDRYVALVETSATFLAMQLAACER